MSKLVRLAVVGALLGSASVATAGDGFLGLRFIKFDDGPAVPQPVPEVAPLPVPGSAPYEGGVPHGTPVYPQGQVYPAPHGAFYPAPHTPGYPAFNSPRICIEDPDHIAPCAVPKTIMVRNPCSTCCDGCDMVPVTICVPPCACEDYKCKKNGCYQKFDYGKYEVEVRVKKGYIEVDYDD